MNRKTIVVAAAAGTLAIAAGTAWAVDADVAPARVAAKATPTTSSTTSSSASSASVLSADDAARLVRARLGGGVVHEVEAEFEHGRPEWKVEITKAGVAYEIRVDAKTGAVTRFETRDGDARLGRDDDGDIDDGDIGDRDLDDRDDDRDDDGRRHGGHGADDGAGDDHGGRHGGDDDRGGDDHGGHGGDDGPGDDHGGDR